MNAPVRIAADKVIKITVREVYGQATVYPACDQAKIFADLAGTKTLTHRALCQIEALGYQIEELPALYAPMLKR